MCAFSLIHSTPLPRHFFILVFCCCCSAPVDARVEPACALAVCVCMCVFVFVVSVCVCARVCVCACVWKEVEVYFTTPVPAVEMCLCFAPFTSAGVCHCLHPTLQPEHHAPMPLSPYALSYTNTPTRMTLSPCSPSTWQSSSR